MEPPPLSDRPTYSDEQMNQFYARISLPQEYRHKPSACTQSIIPDKSRSLDLLQALVRHSLASIPFENLSLHYSPHHTISLDASHLFRKIVLNGTGRGGYCMENNALLSTVLRTLGFDTVTAGARVNENSSQSSSKPVSQSRYSGWSHMINIVTIPPGEGEKYAVDIGFGGGGATTPMRMVEGDPVLNLPPEQFVRLRYGRIPEHTGSDQKVWILERRDGEGVGFRPVYCFTETEFLPQDYAVMNLSTSQNRTSWFTRSVVCVRFLLSEDGRELVGTMALFEDGVRRTVNGKKEELGKFKTELERIEALESIFGVVLNEEERTGIQGMVSAIG